MLNPDIDVGDFEDLDSEVVVIVSSVMITDNGLAPSSSDVTGQVSGHSWELD